MNRDRSVVIAGAGVSGLAAGVLLARKGLAVQVFEASDRVGGCCSSTVIEGYRFHDGALSLGLPRLLDAGFARLGLDRERLLPLRRIDEGYSARFEDGRSVRVGGGRVSLVGANGQVVWQDDAVAGLLERWRPVCRVLTEDVLQHRFTVWRTLRLGGRDLRKIAIRPSWPGFSRRRRSCPHQPTAGGSTE